MATSMVSDSEKARGREVMKVARFCVEQTITSPAQPKRGCSRRKHSTGFIVLLSRLGTSSWIAIAAAAAATTVRERRLPSCRSPPPRTSTLPAHIFVSMTKTPLGPTAT